MTPPRSPSGSNGPFKLVAFDVDGTIADPETGVIPSNVRKAVAHVAAQGVHVVLATGRSWLAAQEAARQLGRLTDDGGSGMTGPPGGEGGGDQAGVNQADSDQGAAWYVCSNGAAILSYPPQNVVALHSFNPSSVVERLDHIEGLEFAAEVFGVGYQVTRDIPTRFLAGELTTVEPRQLAPTPILRLYSLTGRTPLTRAAQVLAASAMTVYRGPDGSLDVCKLGTSKAKGIQVVSERLGIAPSQVLAFGDGHNDIDILKWAGRGVALGQAPGLVKEAADAVAPSFAEGGVVGELERQFG